MVSEYGNNSMSMESGADKVRKHAATFLGSTGLEGAQHTLKEIVGNSLDEANSGFGDVIDVYYLGDGGLAVRDYGRGIPLGWNERYQRYQWQMVYEIDFAGGKYKESESQQKLAELTDADWATFNYDNYRDKMVKLGLDYIMPIGMNGLGSYATCASSEYLVVRSYRDGEVSEMRFERGVHVYDELKVSKSDEKSGTYVEWKPDKEVFTNVNIKSSWVLGFCRGIASANHIAVRFYNGEHAEPVVIEAGDMKSMMAGLVEMGMDGVSYDTMFTHGQDYSNGNGKAGKIHVMAAEIAIGATGSFRFFANSMPTVGGAPKEGAEAAINSFFTDEGKRLGIRFKTSDFSGEIGVAASMHINIMSARGQTKDSIDDHYVYEGIYYRVRYMLQSARAKHAEWLDKVIERVIEKYNERIAFEEARKQNSEITKAIRRKANPAKFKSSRSYESKKMEETELYIVEGKSAGGQTVQSRNSAFQCVYDIRGKGRNVYKADAVEALTGNAEIAEIMNIIGAGTEVGGDFDMGKSRVGKIIMLSDADIDGYHIRILTFLQLLKYVPEFLYEGRFYVAEPPLYMSKLSNGKVKYFVTKEERDEYLGKNGYSVVEEKRFKGLGAMEAEELAETCMNPATRRLQRIQISREDTDLWDTLNVLFGKETSMRKKAFLSAFLGVEGVEGVMDRLAEEERMVESLGIQNELEVEEILY